MASHKRRHVCSLRSLDARKRPLAASCRTTLSRSRLDWSCFRTKDHSSSNSSTVASASVASGSISVSLKAGSLVAFFIHAMTVWRDTRNPSARAHANYCALHTLVESLLGAPLGRHGALDVPGFASGTLGRDISASRWEHDHCAPAQHCRSGDNEPSSLSGDLPSSQLLPALTLSHHSLFAGCALPFPLSDELTEFPVGAAN